MTALRLATLSEFWNQRQPSASNVILQELVELLQTRSLVQLTQLAETVRDEGHKVITFSPKASTHNNN